MTDKRDWHLEQGGGPHDYRFGEMGIVGADGLEVCVISNKDSADLNRALANAHLIIAAPNLLVALKRASEAIRALGGGMHPIFPMAWDALADQCDAALARATDR